MKQLRKLILILLIVIFAGFALLFYFFASSLIQEQSFQQQKTSVQSELRLLQSQLSPLLSESADEERMIAQLASASEAVDERITFIDPEGNVIFDTHTNVKKTENHRARPEIQTAQISRKIGTDIRKSKTTRQSLYYTAVPIETEEGNVIGVLR